MEIIAYPSPLPAQWMAPGSFLDRNPNMSYLLAAGEHALLVDACSNIAAVLNDLQQRRLQLDALLITHHHQDHTFALKDWLREFPDLSIGVHFLSVSALAAAGVKIKQLFPLIDGLKLKLEGETLRMIAAPGHTRDSLCFWDEKGQNLFTGDVIFGGGIGCTDYNGGGNRNVFYQTIVQLLKMLPETAHLYPGHRSEHHQTPPPYELSAEIISNPYLANALAGKRGNFDRALKYFSLEFETAEAVLLDESSLDDICELEQEIWIPPMQASREVIQERLHHGHKLLTIKDEKGLPGMVGWCYSPFSRADGPDGFPKSFRQFSNCKSCCADNARSAFIYNVGVKPNRRRQGTGSLLLQEVFEKIRKAGIFEVFIDSRMASYNGSTQYDQEKVPRNEVFRKAVDQYFSTGRLPETAVLASDPAVSFYMRNGLTPWIIRPDFIPDDPSGNMRVICYANLDQEGPL
ncbi:MAG: GNAT family N-acetyltransferase [Deltaproteobacteria bacterium]|nr:GNAT family N-acetyltransferase [Deltaproteobacteria bacterium]